MAAIAGDQPFIMKPDGVGWLYALRAVMMWPMPAHYEPVESPVGNLFYPAKQACKSLRYRCSKDRSMLLPIRPRGNFLSSPPRFG